MDNLTIAAASGMRSRLETLDLLANNIANAATAGFKADHEFYNLYVSSEATASERPALLPVLESQWTDFGQGSLIPTGNALDLALSGPGFFVVEGPNGPLLTRNGNLNVNLKGELQTRERYSIRGHDGKPVRVDPAQPFEVAPDGSVRQNGETAGVISLADAPASWLEKAGASYFRLTKVDQLRAAAGLRVLQGKLESSNSSSAETAVRLVNVLRQFEMLQRAVGIGGEMNRKAVEEVARVSQ